MCFDQCNECLGFKSGEYLVYPSDSLKSRENLQLNFRRLKNPNINLRIALRHPQRSKHSLGTLFQNTFHYLALFTFLTSSPTQLKKKKQKLTKIVGEMQRGKHLHSWARLTVLTSCFTRQPRPNFSCRATEK